MPTNIATFRNRFEAVYSCICKLSTISNRNYRLLTGYRAEITVVTNLSIAQVKRATMHVFTSPPRGCYVAMEVSVDDFVTRAINLHASILDRSIVHGTNTNDLSQLQKENMATLFNQIGLWSGRWERFLNIRAVAAPSTPGPVRPRPRPIRAAVPSSPPAKRSRLTSQSVSSHRTSRPGPSWSPPSQERWKARKGRGDQEEIYDRAKEKTTLEKVHFAFQRTLRLIAVEGVYFEMSTLF